MNWWIPFQIIIKGDWAAGILGIVGAIAGGLLGYWLENIRNRKNERAAHKRNMVVIQSEIESIALHLISLAKSCMITHLGYVFLERKTREQVQFSLGDYKLHLAQIDINRKDFNEALNKYDDHLYEFYKYVHQFCSYLGEEDGERIVKMAFKLPDMELRKYEYLYTVNEKEIQDFDSIFTTKALHPSLIKHWESRYVSYVLL